MNQTLYQNLQNSIQIKNVFKGKKLQNKILTDKKKEQLMQRQLVRERQSLIIRSPSPPKKKTDAAI